MKQKLKIYKIWSTKLSKMVNIEAPNMYTALEQARLIEKGARVKKGINEKPV